MNRRTFALDALLLLTYPMADLQEQKHNNIQLSFSDLVGDFSAEEVKLIESAVDKIQSNINLETTVLKDRDRGSRIKGPIGNTYGEAYFAIGDKPTKVPYAEDVLAAKTDRQRVAFIINYGEPALKKIKGKNAIVIADLDNIQPPNKYSEYFSLDKKQYFQYVFLHEIGHLFYSTILGENRNKVYKFEEDCYNIDRQLMEAGPGRSLFPGHVSALSYSYAAGFCNAVKSDPSLKPGNIFWRVLLNRAFSDGFSELFAFKTILGDGLAAKAYEKSDRGLIERIRLFDELVSN